MTPAARACCLALLACLGGGARADTPWTPFEWGVRNGPGPVEPHAAIFLPVTLDGAPCRMQFDSGAGLSVLYRMVLPAAMAAGGDTVEARLDIGTLAATRARLRRFPLRYPDDPGKRTAGWPAPSATICC